MQRCNVGSVRASRCADLLATLTYRWRIANLTAAHSPGSAARQGRAIAPGREDDVYDEPRDVGKMLLPEGASGSIDRQTCVFGNGDDGKQYIVVVYSDVLQLAPEVRARRRLL